MTTRLRIAFVLGLVVGLAVASAPAEAARPPSELALFTRLNGAPQRFVMTDGGVSGLYGSAATCMTVTSPDILKLQCSAAVHVCAASTDAGCNTTATDINYGEKLAADTAWYLVVDDVTSTALCMVPASGSANCPVWKMR